MNSDKVTLLVEDKLSDRKPVRKGVDQARSTRKAGVLEDGAEARQKTPPCERRKSEMLRLLHIEDCRNDSLLMVCLLEKAGYDVHAERVEDAAGMRAALATHTWDLVVADYHLPGFDAPAALEVLRETGLDLPFIVVSGTMGENVAVSMMKAGAHDYLIKGTLARLVPAVARELRDARVRQERRQAEESLRLALLATAERERLLDAVFTAQTDGVFVSDSSGLVIRTNPVSAAFFGFDPTGMRIAEVMARFPLAIDVDSCATSRALRGETVINFEYTRGDLVVESSASPMRDAAGAIVGAVTISRDISEQKRAGQALRASEERYRLISENTADVIWLLDVDSWRFTFVSPSVHHLLGYAPEELLAKDFGFTLTPAGYELANTQLAQSLSAFEGDAKTARTQVQQLDQVRKDGSIVRTEVVATFLPDPQGHVREILGVTRDVTERLEAEARLMQAQKLESVGRLAGGVAHDFNNLLTVINGYSNMLLDELSPSDPLHEQVSEIRTAGERAAALSAQLLVLSRKQVIQPKVTNLNDIIVEVQRMLGRVIGEDIRLASVLEPSLGCVMADPGQLHQVLMNLAVNGRDAMPSGGTLLIETTNVDLDRTFAEDHTEVRPGPYICLRVSDTGTGMSKDVLSHIFEPFYTTKQPGKGTGLGLATVYGIVKQSGGSIWVYSERGLGTSFTIYLPRIESAGKAQKRPERDTATLRGTETVLVVEDQEQLRKMAARVLRSHGYQVEEAANPGEALLYAEHHPGTIHLLLTDVVMPGMSGCDLSGRLQPLRPAMKVVFMSGYSEHSMLNRQGLDAGAAYLTKPFSPEALAIKVREVLGSKRSAGTILVADDEPGVRSFLRKVLTGAGYQVLEAKNGREATRQVETSEVDLLITDLAMPEQEGIETIQTLHRVRPQLKIIAMSGQFGRQLLTVMERLGAHASIAKPIQADELLRILQTVMRT